MIRGKRDTGAATVTLATIATDGGGSTPSVAKVATVTVANPQRAELRLASRLMADRKVSARVSELRDQLSAKSSSPRRCHAEYVRLGEQPHG